MQALAITSCLFCLWAIRTNQLSLPDWVWIFLLPAVVAFAALTLMPKFVPALTTGLAFLFNRFISAESVLIRRRTQLNVGLATGYLAPVALLSCIVGGFMVGIEPFWENKRKMLIDSQRYDQALFLQNYDQANTLFGAAREETLVLRFASTRKLWEVSNEPIENDPQFTFVDMTRLSAMIELDFIEGDLADTHPRGLVSSRPHDSVGDEIVIQSSQGETVRGTVLATVEDNLVQGLMLDWSQLEVLKVPDNDLDEVRLYARGTPLTVDHNIKSLSLQEDAAEVIRQAQQQSLPLNRVLLAVLCFICFLGLIQGIFIALEHHRHEYALLRSLGASKMRVSVGYILEIVTQLLCLSVLSGAICFLFLSAVSSGFSLKGASPVTMFDWGIFISLYVSSAIVCLVASAGVLAFLASKHYSTEYEGISR